MTIIFEAPGRAAACAGGQARPRPAGLARRAMREPVVQFFVIGGLLLAASTALDGARAKADRTIVVDAARVRRLGELYQAQMGAAPEAQQMRGLVADYVRDEALYREAVRRNLGAEDEIVRRRLIQKMAFVQASKDAADPSEAQLHAYYDRHAKLFVRPASMTFDQVFFDGGQGDARAHDRAEAASTALAQGQDWRGLGDPFPAQARYDDVSRPDIEATFGPAIASALFAAPAGVWSAPMRSGLGWHIMRVQHASAAQTLPFERVRDNVLDRYLQDAQADADAKAEQDVVARYTVRLPKDLQP